jgi:hypothetical protein
MQRSMSPLLAQSRHKLVHRTCPLCVHRIARHFSALGKSFVVVGDPVHYCLWFRFLTGTVEAPRKEMKRIKGLKIHALKPGEKL